MTDIERLKRYKSLYERNCEYEIQATSNAEDQADIKELYYKNIHTFDNAIAALEKQIPKKVTVRKIGYKLLDYICPCCTYKQISQCGGEWVAGQKYKYCSHCGQALDWSDTE